MMTAEQLKASILQLAMEGKLVEQRPEEGTGEELYRQIQTEKAKLIKEGKIKKQKLLPEITAEEKPFDIPESWKWVRIGNVISLLSGADLTPDKYNDQGKGIPYITGASCIADGNVIVNRWTESPKNIAHKGDLLLTCKGTVGKTAILKEESVHIARQIMAITSVSIDTTFIDYYLQLIVESLKKQAKSMIPGIERNTVLNACLPLPTLLEQRRIVQKINKLMPYVTQYATASEKLDKLNTEFPDQLKKSILQMAVEGKLVDQRPEEGTGEELFRKIQEEKVKLIKTGKIKQQKPLADITDEEKTFDIPESWKWLRLDQIATVVTDGEHKTPRRVSKYCGYYLLSARNVLNGRIQLSDVDYVDEEEFLSISKRCNPVRGDVLISCSGTIGRCTIVDDDNAYVMVRSAAMVRALIVPEYLMYCLQSAFLQEQMRKNAKQTAQANLFQAAIRNLVLPVPPLEEQKRIVEKLHKVLPTVNKLK